jgi:hypothetical protein
LLLPTFNNSMLTVWRFIGLGIELDFL